MNPLQYEDLYHKLVVSLNELGTTTVDVHRYQNNDAKLKSNAFLGNAEALKHKDQLVGKMTAESKQEKKLATAKPDPADAGGIMGPFNAVASAIGSAVHLSNSEVLRRLRPTMMTVHSGKGSPEEIATALHLVAKYKLYDKKIADEGAGVRDYCDKYIGLDCNGFVGNYARTIGKSKVPNTPIGSYASKTNMRTKLEDVQADDVLVWTDHGHIAVIHSIEPLGVGPDGKPARDCIVVEATAGNPSGSPTTKHGGLQHSTYSIRRVGADHVFVVERPKGGSHSHVYIAPL